jgi:dipeptidyl aminopeptidase/acylaminoacyl peptidase
MNSLISSVLALGLLGSIAASAGTVPSIEEFAARPRIEGATISPDGRYVALIQTTHGRAAAVVIDRTSAATSDPRVVMGEPDHFQMSWCHWATNTRLLCAFVGMARDETQRNFVYAVTRLAAVDADGRNQLVLIQDNELAGGQFQDRIIDWYPGPKDTVLIEADEVLTPTESIAGTRVFGDRGTYAFPAVFELNVITGRLSMRQHSRAPIRNWVTDNHGQVRLGSGFAGTTISYYARLDGGTDWRRLTKFEAFTHDDHFTPIAISAQEPNKAYASGPYEGRTALWLIDLTDQEDPSLIFAHPAVDVGNPVLDRDDRLLAVNYDPGYPMMYFTDERVAAVTNAVTERIPGKFSSIVESTLDRNVYLLRSYSDLEPPTFRVLDVARKSLVSMGSAYPDRDLSALAPMRSISYPARDGTVIPAYLSTPTGIAAGNLPLIVMPHGGPIARDRWDYFFLREFLVSRGYAVLQMNFRGSDGYGGDWFYAAHQDWGGLTYDDVVDATKWAIEHGIADPRRIGIVGWSFGGYLALLGAQRNADLFRCSVDIAGVSDLGLLIDEERHYTSSESIKKQIGTDAAKLRLNSPRQHAAEFKVPLLMLHGDRDAQVPIAHSEDMDSALKHAGRSHRFVTFPDTDHSFSAEKSRAAMLHEIEGFLAEHLAASPGQ